MTQSKKKTKTNTDSETPENWEETDYSKASLKSNVGDSLRNLYNEVIDEDIPDEFLAILRTDPKSGN